MLKKKNILKVKGGLLCTRCLLSYVVFKIHLRAIHEYLKIRCSGALNSAGVRIFENAVLAKVHCITGCDIFDGSKKTQQIRNGFSIMPPFLNLHDISMFFSLFCDVSDTFPLRVQLEDLNLAWHFFFHGPYFPQWQSSRKKHRAWAKFERVRLCFITSWNEIMC